MLVLPAEGYTGRYPPLPPGDWRGETRRWYRTWARSPQAAAFLVTDWLFLAETAVLVEEFHGGNVAVAAELRLRQAKLGVTAEDRTRLRMTVDGPATEPPAREGRYADLIVTDDLEARRRLLFAQAEAGD